MKLFKRIISIILVITIMVSTGIFSVNATTVYESENNDSYSTANTITLGNTMSGSLNSRNESDIYKIVSPANGKINIDFCHSYGNGASWGICIYQYYNGEYIELSNVQVSKSDKEKVTLPYVGAIKNGIYYIEVFNPYYHNEGLIGENYKIKTSFTISEPTIKSVTNTTKGVSLKWNKVKEAKGYIIYRKTGSGQYKQLTKVTNKKKVTYIDKKVKSGTKYTYAVTSYNKNYESKKSKAKTIKYIKKSTK